MRIGITMRTVRETSYAEVRDALDQAWWPFLASALPGDLVVPLPNEERAAVAMFAGLELDGLILTGGDDLGASPERDRTEAALLAACTSRGVPVFGVCRGLQFVAVEMGGARVVRCDRDVHVARRHRVSVEAGILPFPVPGSLTTNSYHGWAPVLDVGSSMKPWCRAEDGTLEGVFDGCRRILAIGWHPEREPFPDPVDVALFRNHFHGVTA